jgi:phage terminase large subunit
MCNPGGVGHQNIKRLFITREYRRSENPRDYTFIQAHVWDNIPLMLADYGFSTAWKEYRRKNRGAKLDEKTIKKLMYFSDYVKSLDNLPETLREAYLEGNWDIFAGQYFSEFNEDVHVMSEAEIVAKLHKEGYEGEGLPRHWRRSAGLDHGLDRFAALWFATDEKGQTYCYRNYEATDVIISASAKIFKELSRHPDGTPENIEIVTAPFDFWSRERTDAKSRAELYYDNGIPLVKAGRERVAGWMNVKEYLKYESHKTDDNQLAIDKPPKMIFLDSCAWILKYLPLLQSDPKKPSDVATEPHEITHSPDALRGWCSIHQGGTYVPPPPPVYNFESEKPKSTGLGEVTEEYLTGGY